MTPFNTNTSDNIPEFLNLKVDFFSSAEIGSFIRMRWMIIITISGLILVETFGRKVQMEVLSMLFLFILSNLFMDLFSKKIFNLSFFIDAIFVTDTIFVTLILYFIGKVDSDFYIIFYFLVILLVSMNQDMRSVVVMGAIVSLIYGWVLFSMGAWKLENSFRFFFRVPLIFVITIFYSYILNRSNQMRKQVQEYKSLAMHDELTRLPNRRYLNEYLKWELRRSVRYNAPVSFLMIDIDDFKNINDDYGHDVGDEVLSKLAYLLKCNKRENDLIARFGGEEFVWVAPGTEEKKAEVVASKLLEKIRKSLFEAAGKELKLTVSMGISTFVPRKHNLDMISDIVNKADEALYKAKFAGKNRWAYLAY